jgi:4-amino-4-deoxy-L-arabinose transferase-like glycosyltransferase
VPLATRPLFILPRGARTVQAWCFMRSQSATMSIPLTRRSALLRPFTNLPILLFGFFVGIYALTSAGQLDSVDGVVVALSARSLVLHHTLALPPSDPATVLGVGGFGYSKYGIAQSLVEIPFVVLGLLLRHLTRTEQAVDWMVAFTNTFITAAGCAVFFVLVRRLGASARRGVAITLLYGLCTLAWPYAKTDFSEPLQTLSLLLAAYAALRAGTSARYHRWLVGAGAALGLAILTKPALLVTVPAFGLYVASAEMLDPQWRWHSPLLRTARWWLDTAARLVALLTPVLLAVVVVLWLNVVRFGSPLDFGYGRAAGDAPFSGPLLEGFFGLLLSFNTGLLFYATPVVLGLVGVRRFGRRQPRELLLIGAMAILLLVLNGGYRYWAGLAAFGPRYLVPLIPFLLLPVIDAFPGVWARGRAHGWALAAIVVVVIAGMAEQLLGIVVSFGAYSVLTCVQFPCPASLDASQSEILYDIWLLPVSVVYNLLGHVPHIVLANYPFGAPPVGRANWQTAILTSLRYFWFTLLPHPRASLAAGLLLCGSLSAACLTALARKARLVPIAAQRAAAAPAPALAAVASGTTRSVATSTDE